jgi:hypothetical protein
MCDNPHPLQEVDNVQSKIVNVTWQAFHHAFVRSILKNVRIMFGRWRFGSHSSSENEVPINFRRKKDQGGHRFLILHKAPLIAGVLMDTIVYTHCSLHVQTLKELKH